MMSLPRRTRLLRGQRLRLDILLQCFDSPGPGGGLRVDHIEVIDAF